MLKTNLELAAAAENAAKNLKTFYILGCFGAPMNEANKARYSDNLAYNRKENRKKKIMAASADTFGFDCSGFVKGLLWGFTGDKNRQYGGAVYQAEGIPDKSANAIISLCSDVSDAFASILPGEYLWCKDHCGIYIGGGLAAECTHRWADGVQITRVHNLIKDDGTPGRRWEKHGKLPWIDYLAQEDAYSLKLSVLKRGSRGAMVKALQQMLISNGFSCGDKGADGEFGANTERALLLCQMSMELPATGETDAQLMNRLLGVITWKRL